MPLRRPGTGGSRDAGRVGDGPAIDYAVMGEGKETALELLAHLAGAPHLLRGVLRPEARAHRPSAAGRLQRAEVVVLEDRQGFHGGLVEHRRWNVPRS